MDASFFREFTVLSTEDQLAKLRQAVGGEQGYQKLLWESPEGIKVHPIYTNDHVSNKSMPTEKSLDWKVTQHITIVGDKETCLWRMQNALNMGVEALYLEFLTPCPFFEELIFKLEDSNCALFFVFLYLPSQDQRERIATLVNAKLCFDFFGTGLRQGGWAVTQEQWFSLLKNQKKANLFVNASIYGDAGATIHQQLLYALMHLNEYLTTLSQNKYENLLEVHIQFAFGSNYFFEIAKSIVFTSLAEHLFKAYGFSPKLILLGAPLQRNKCCVDYNVNLLRSSAEIMSAVLGEVDYVMNLPYDLRFNPPNDFGDRIARNQLLLLKYESGFDHLHSPAQGSYYLEALVEELKSTVWEDFRLNEEAGGWLTMVKKNVLQDAIAQADLAERYRLKNGDQVLVGVTKYQDATALSTECKTKEKRPPFTSFTALPIHYLDE